MAGEAEVDRRQSPRQTVAGLLSGRVTFRPAGNHDQRVGEKGFTPYGDPANRVPVSVGHRSRLSSKQTRRRSDQSATEYGNHQPVPGSVLTYASA